MSRRHRKKRKSIPGEVELNLAAMLDMAFQLLAFFILTFQPSPVEGQVSLRMPPPIPLTEQGGSDIGSDTVSDAQILGKERVVITLRSNPNGELLDVCIGESTLTNQATVEQEMVQLRARLPKYFTNTPLDEVVIQVGSGLHYEQLMEVVQVCTEQKLANGERLSKLTFVEYADGSFELGQKAPPKP
jgi:biopolymer transport protein ExbD